MQNSKYANVLVEIGKFGTKTFSYLIPKKMRSEIQIGQAVLVPFGNNRKIKAFVVGFCDYLNEKLKAKYITEILDKSALFDLEYLKLLEFISNYYYCDIQNVLASAIPMNFLNQNKKCLTKKYIKIGLNENYNGLKKRQIEILNKLKKIKNEIEIVEFEKEIKTTRKTLETLEEKRFVKIYKKNIYRNPLNIFETNQVRNEIILTKPQEKACEEIKSKFQLKKPILLHGITGSGKTEIYFNLMEDTIKTGKNVLFLAPEIALASQLTQRIINHFSQNDVAIWHSSISQGEKFDVWNKLKKNEIKILVGARSCVFAPLKNIGLIILDEEHDASYKQTNPTPRYDARFVAEYLAKLNNCPLIFGTATPDISTYYKAINSKTLVELNSRYKDANLAKVVVIDMKQEQKDANNGLFSRTLVNAINKNLEDKKQTILLINRRGFSTSIQCTNCFDLIECPKCSIPMVFHSTINKLKCHYCNFEKDVPKYCEKCGGILKNIGAGTQRIEEIAGKIFKNAIIKRIDSDILSTKKDHVEILKDFKFGKIDILIGTQMIAKGLDNQNVTLVGVINADGSFTLPDFRAQERGFQLLTQVAGRAGRGKDLGKVYFQTFNPDFTTLLNAKEQNYFNFYKEEIENRKIFDYPPFSKIIRIILSSRNNFRAEKSAQEITLRLIELIEKLGIKEKLEILGSCACILEKIKEEYRFQILIKNKIENKGHKIIGKFLNQIIMPKDVKMIVDVDPLDIL